MLRKLFQIELVNVLAVSVLVVSFIGATDRADAQENVVNEIVVDSPLSNSTESIFSTELIAANVDAHETFAPLITKDCVMFIHLDLRKVNIEQVKFALAKAAEHHLKDLQFDDKSFKATSYEFGKFLREMDKIIRPKFELITKKLGIRELAVVVDFSSDNIPMMFVAIPFKGKTHEDAMVLSQLLEQAGIKIKLKEAGDFLIFTHEVKLKETAEWVTAAVPSRDAVIHKALREAGNSEIKIAITTNELIRKEFKNLPDTAIKPQVKNVISFALNKLEWISMSMSLGQFVDASKKVNFRTTIKVPQKADAVSLRNLIEGSIDSGILLTKTSTIATDTDPNVAIFLPMILEYYGGFGRKFLPEVKDDRLVLSYEMSQHFSNHDLAYIGLGIAFLVPAFQAANEAESKMYCLNNIKQIILGFHSYNDVHDELPPLYTVDANGKPLHSWRVLILPYIGQEELYKSIKLDEAWDSEHNKQFHNADIPIYSSPAIKNYRPNKKCNYAVIEGQPLKPKDGTSFDDIKDGLENTIAIVVVNRPFCWMNPKANITLEDIADGEYGDGGIIGYNQTDDGSNFGFWNWNVKMLPKNISPEKLKALSTANGGEAVSPQ